MMRDVCIARSGFHLLRTFTLTALHAYSPTRLQPYMLTALHACRSCIIIRRSAMTRRASAIDKNYKSGCRMICHKSLTAKPSGFQVGAVSALMMSSKPSRGACKAVLAVFGSLKLLALQDCHLSTDAWSLLLWETHFNSVRGPANSQSTLVRYVRGMSKLCAYFSSLLGSFKVLWNCPDFRFRLGLYLPFLYELVIRRLDDAFKALERLGHYCTCCLHSSVLVLQERIDTAFA
jgi:hypothetical protein